MAERRDVAGGWVDVSDPDDVLEGKHRAFMRAWRFLMRLRKDELDQLQAADPEAESTGSAEADDALQALDDALVVALVDAWSWDLPVEVESLQKLPRRVSKALSDLCAPFFLRMLPDFAPPPLGTVPDPKADTADSAG